MGAMKNDAGRSDMLKRMPLRHLRLLKQIGRWADEQGLPLYLVGGVVRDLLLHRQNWDLDLTVEGDGIAFARLVADRCRAGIVTFERFATARLVLPNGSKIDLATTRRESYVQPAALPDVEPASLKDDLYRRDFTINAMAIQLNGAQFGFLHDPYGGQRDLMAKTIRVLHEGSFVDDPTRIFRAVRFAQRFGFRLEPATRRLLKQAAATKLIAQLSGPRLCNELFLLFGEREPAQSIDALERLRLWRFVHPRLRYQAMGRRLVSTLPRAFTWWARQQPKQEIERPLVYLMALLSHSSRTVLESASQRLQLSARQAAAVKWAGRLTDDVARLLLQRNAITPSRVYRRLIDMPDDAIVLILAKGFASQDRAGARRLVERVARFLKQDRRVTTLLDGEDLKGLGLKPGPQFKTILTRLLEARIDGRVRSEEAERAFVRHIAGRPGSVTVRR